MYRKRRSLSRSDWNRRINGKYPGKTQKKGMVIRVNPNVNLLGDGMVSLQDLEKEVEYILKNNILFIPDSFTVPFLTNEISLNNFFYDISPQNQQMDFNEDNLLEWVQRHVTPFEGLDARYWRVMPSLNYINYYIKSDVQQFGDIQCAITYSNPTLSQMGIEFMMIDMLTTKHDEDVSCFNQLFALCNPNLSDNHCGYFDISTSQNDGFIVTNRDFVVNNVVIPFSRSTIGKIDLISTDGSNIGKNGELHMFLANGSNFNGITIELGMYFTIEYIKPN